MRTIDQLLRYALVICLMVPMLGAALIVGLVSGDYGWRIVRRWHTLALRIFGISTEIQYEGSPSQLDKGGIVVSLNQQSLLDPSIAYAAWDKRILSIWNFEYTLIPFFGWSTLLLGWIIVRQAPAQAKRQIRKAAQYAREGGLVHLSAEGKRSTDGSLSPYKKGPVVMAIEAQVPIHPVYIVGTRRCMPVGEWKIRPGKVVIKYLPPLHTKGLAYEDRNRLLQQLRAVAEAEHAKVSTSNVHRNV